MSTPDNSTIVVTVDNEFYTLGIKEGVINQLYTCNQFAVCKEQLLSPEKVATDQSVRESFHYNFSKR